jgi:hypothetical protein
MIENSFSDTSYIKEEEEAKEGMRIAEEDDVDEQGEKNIE